jgi:hypothetical protein
MSESHGDAAAPAALPVLAVLTTTERRRCSITATIIIGPTSN